MLSGDDDALRTPPLGLVVNPIAGMGGRVALKGTDGAEALALARARGAEPVAPQRARAGAGAAGRQRAGDGDPGRAGRDGRATSPLRRDSSDVASDARRRRPRPPRRRDRRVRSHRHTAADTRAAVAEMRERGVDLLLFAGGDGTARDILDAIGDALPLRRRPDRREDALRRLRRHARRRRRGRRRLPARPRPGRAARRPRSPTSTRTPARAGRVSTRLYGSVRVPRAAALMLAAKAAAAAPATPPLRRALPPARARRWTPGRLTLLGPGTTTARVLAPPRPARHAARRRRRPRRRGSSARDLDEAGAARAARRPTAHARSLGVVGGQGSLFGRGNQQLSPRVLRRLGPERRSGDRGRRQAAALDPPALRVDTGDDALDAQLSRLSARPRRRPAGRS